MSAAFQVYKFTDDIRDGRYLTANSDGSMRWTLTRGDAHKLTRKEAETMAAWVRKVFIGHMAIVVPEDKSPWEVLRAKPRGTKLNPRKRRASPAQLAARAKFAAMAKARALGRRGKRAVKRGARKLARKSRAAARAFRNTNPRKRDAFQIAAAKGDKILFLSGVAMTSNREAASNYGTISTARKIAKQVRDVGRQFGISRVAVVTSHDHPRAIRSFLLGGA
jgi:hypothetical protein